MLTQAQVRSIQDLVQHPGPVLSLYLSTNPAQEENAGRAYLARAKEQMKALGVPKEIFDKVLARLEEDRPQARTRVIFAGENLLEIYDLQVDLPLSDGIEARWGQPYLTPLLYAIDEHERRAVVLVDQEKWRLFEVVLGEIEELEGAFRAVNPEEWRDLGEDATAAGGRSAGPGAPGHVGRASGGSGKDHFSERMGEWTERFYKEMAHHLVEVMKSRGIEQLVLMGPDPDTKNFAAHLPENFPKPYILPSAPHSRVSAGEILKIVERELPPLERERELKLLEQIRENGVSGVDQVISLLQEGRIHLLVAPWKLEGTVFRCPSGMVGMTREAARAYCPGEQVEEVSLKEALPRLAQAYAARLEFVHGEAEERLLREFGGLAGLLRW
ncbi:MAG: VLRF1 family aeRF1-type release factor [Deinococcota bacterium]|nr:hypothetical protein [Allomeiothermus silvanus]